MRRVAITGFGVVSPIGTGREAFWTALAAGRGGIAPISRFDASAFEVRLAGEVKEPLNLPAPVQALAAEDAKIGFGFAALAEALAQAGLAGLDRQALLHLGTSLEVFDLRKIIAGCEPDFAAVVRRSLGSNARPLQVPLDQLARLAAATWGQPGRSLTNCSACAAGAQAIGHGFRAVRSGEFEVAVCGGFDSMLHPLGVGGFQLLGALTIDNDRGQAACRPFDAARAGTVLGEGAAMLVLEPLDKVLAEGRPVLGELCGYGSSLDAASLSAPDPSGDGAIRAMRAALADAQIAPEQIAHLNAHGTGTQLNDEIEAKAIRQVFAGCWERIPVSATKALTGHLIAAAGAVEAGACLLALQRGILPPNPWLETVGPGCELNHVRCVAGRLEGEYVISNSFGFGGQNAALIFRRGTSLNNS
jgi:3-oxoacyl-[acyl-carrier-protein] synthase II